MQSACFYKVFIYWGLGIPKLAYPYYTPVWRNPVDPITISRMVWWLASCSLIAPPLDTEILDLRWDPFLEKKSCFIKTKGFMKTLGGIFPTEWVYKMELLWRSMVLENVFGWKKVLIKQHMVLCNYPLQHHRATTLPWGGRGLVCSLSVLVWNSSYSYKG